ncbi:endonuclease G, mitochondrial-like [Onychostoma macrolepis]|uniref:endonuclease G, mitochondrial-like n=1 Tax=Onychostoma macrolepis TaxID=369639 RepID=UPI00272C4310|nr:endonuclease G, mitochondrial-like [Onychostoma macrolepis]
MDCVKKQRSKSSSHDKTTLKKRREKATLEARNRKSNRTEANLVRSCSKLSLSDSGADEENESKNPQRSRRRSTQTTQPSSIIKQDAYIQIPLSVMSGKESTSNKNQLISHEDESPSSPVEGQKYEINYKLIDGFPSCAEEKNKEKIRKRKSYVMSYDTETKNAEWVYEILNESTLENTCKEHMSFGKKELENRDYQQGHLAAAANHRWCQEAYHDTYLMSNMIPQLSALNQGMWKSLEEYCRQLAEPGCNVHVYTGPLYLCKNKKGDYVRVLDPKNPNNSEEKAVPTHLFKVIIVEKNGRVEEPKCYVMPNKKQEYKKSFESAQNFPNTDKLELEELEKSIEEIQIWSGLKFKIDKPQHNMIEHTEPITWKGEDGKGESCEAKIAVTIHTVIKTPISDTSQQ